MKILKFLSLFLATGLILVSCQKDLSFEDGTAKGTLKYDATGDCMPVTVNGIYKKDTALKAANYIDIRVNITSTGAYDIKTDTVNGYSFRGRGETAVTGLNTIRLLGTGKPLIAPSTDIFTVTLDTSSCEVSVSVITGAAPAAVYTIDCTGATPTGTYQIGTSTTGNTVTISATPTVLGTYSIITDTQNGVTFTGSGTFTGTAGTARPVVLTASSGVATGTAGSVAYTASAAGGTSACTFNITYTAAPPPAIYTIDCTGATTAGTYTAGVPATSSNTVTISGTSTGAGSYSVTATANGITFTGGGTFPSATTQPIVLTANGIPAASGNFPFTATAATGGSTCTFNVTFAAAAATDYIRCRINGGPLQTFNTNIDASLDNSGGFPFLDIYGEASAASSETFDIQITKASGTINAGTYTVNMLSSLILLGAYYTDAAFIDYSMETDLTGATQTPGFTVIISSITATRVTGTFSGEVKNTGGTVIKTISNGEFSVPL